jgi:outer membrane biosynthesis protein TonB
MASPSTSSRPLVAALAISVALHLGLVVWLARVPARPVVAPRPPVVADFEVVVRPPPVPPAPPAVVAPPPKPLPLPPQKVAARPVAPKAVVTPPPAAPAPAAPVPEPMPQFSPPPVIVAVPMQVKKALPNFALAASQAAQKLDLEPSGVVVQALDLDGGAPTRAVLAPHVIEDADQRTASMIGEKQGRERVQHGLVDPYFGQVSKALAKGWNPEPKITDPSLQYYLKRTEQNFATGMKVYSKLAESYGAGGSPLGPSDTPRAGSKEEEVREFRAKMRESWKQSKRTLVRVTQGPGGLIAGVELVQSSADPEMDAEILRELRQGEVQLPIPPQSGMGIHTPIHATWSFELIISISPPVPTIAGSFDEVTGKIDVRMPLDRRVYKYVQLVSVD